MLIPEARLRPLLGASFRCGGPALWGRLRGGRTKILMYHGIPAAAGWTGIANWYGYSVAAAEFEQHLLYLLRSCHVLSLRDFLAGRGLSRRQTNVVITFDDGYENNASQALPLLRKHRVPATLALTTGFVLQREPLYNDRVEFAVQNTAKARVRLLLRGAEREFAPVDQRGRLELYDHLMYECVTMPQEQRSAFIDAACAELGVRADAESMFGVADYRPMTPEQVRAMAGDELVEVASHSVHHFLLARSRHDTMLGELQQSKQDVERMIGAPCRTFCVPGGSWNREMADAAFASGYDCVLTSDAGIAARGERVLKRIGVFHQPDLWWFADTVQGPVQELVGKARGLRRRLAAKFVRRGGAVPSLPGRITS